jgi:hypothetical protein
MVVTGWHNGDPNLASGGGYGVKIDGPDRDRQFRRKWANVTLELAAGRRVVVPLSPAFWRGCRELRSKHIGRWMLDNRVAPWPKGSPPKLRLEPTGEGKFRLSLR